MPGGFAFERVDDINLRVVLRNDLFTAGKTTFFIVFTTYDVNLATELADCELAPLGLHRSQCDESVLGRFGHVPFDYCPRGLSALSDDIVAVFRLVKNRRRYAPPLVLNFI